MDTQDTDHATTEPARQSGRLGTTRSAIAVLVAVWLAWAGCLLVFQELVQERVRIERPDRVLVWTADETGVRRNENRPYLREAVLNSHVAFDSEYYLSIAVFGYDDPDVGEMQPEDGSPPIPLNYAFMPLYPLVIGGVAVPLGLIGLGPVAAATVAGVLVSLAAALAAVLAMFSLARRRLGDAGGIRAGVFLLVFPTGFFLAQVYTEALFLALALGSLALLADRRPLLAASLAVLATWTRPIGVVLVLPIALALIDAILAAIACVWSIRHWPGVAIFSLAALVIPLTSGAPQSMVRYVLAVPAVFLLLARLGANPVFDRAWMLASTLLMGLLVTLFVFDFWVA